MFSPTQRSLWTPAAPHIWAINATGSAAEDYVSVIRTLLDQPRWLEAQYLYDEHGSHLFEEICELPEYYLTRTENSILAECADQVISAAPVECIVELGSGTSKKTAHLLRQQIKQRGRGIFAPIDVSLSSLEASRDLISEEFPELTFNGLCARYEEGMSGVDKTVPKLFVFLGSTIGNFNRSEFSIFFRRLSQSMGPKDFLLLGVDRVKDTPLLEKAYDDSRGVTAEFILNVFRHVNRRLGSDFDRAKMRYHSWYNPQWQQIEMYAISTAAQEIHFPSFDTSFVWEENDRILVEISRKFEPRRLQSQLQFFGLKSVGHFTDPREWFSVLLFRKSQI
ncbi:MAG: L-histidine N(alpha)-methyltransferase [Deltaproteobacteria bacterium]|nr:L-histidine N(alpha)-methyltransferase [Deltaproteobacteria bacterium]